MTLQIDTSRAPRRPTELRALVRAVEQATAEDEADWIEWKSDLDLSVKVVRATLARHIIGMANRRVEEAHRFAEGFGFILVGVEPGNRCGITRVDLADLDAGIAPYLGPNGPRWTASYDTDSADGRSVLVIAVDPPQQGDPVHMLRRQFEKYRDGDVFVRNTARTERHSADLEYLMQRAVPRRPGLELGVFITPVQPVLRPLIGLDEAVESWIGAQRVRLLASATEPPLGPPHPSRYVSFDGYSYAWYTATSTRSLRPTSPPLPHPRPPPLHTALVRSGNNLNQLGKWANTERRYPAENAAAVAYAEIRAAVVEIRAAIQATQSRRRGIR